MIIRELIAQLGLDVNDADFDKADQTLNRVKHAATALVGVLAGAGIGRAIHSMVEEASGVEETLNVIRETFEHNTGAVVDWAASTATEVNRSRFSLQKYAADLGAIVKPMLGNTDAATEMSTTLAALSVDLASFFNLQDSEAMVRLTSGIVGETEAVRRLGVDLSVAGMEAFALTQGITKSFKDMTQAEKVSLRFQKIMKDTADAQGDAARTANAYANASRGMAEAIKDLRTEIGMRFLPGATRMVVAIRDGVNAFLTLAEGTKIVEATLIGLGTVAAVVGAYMVIPFLPMIAIALGIAAAFAAVVIAAEDIYAFFTGRGSVIGMALRSIGVDAHKVQGVFAKVGEVASYVWDGIKDKVAALAEVLGPHLADVGDVLLAKVIEWGAKIGPVIDAILAFDVESAIKQASQFFSRFGGKIAAFLQSPIGKALTALVGAYLGKKAGELAGSETGKALGSLFGKSRLPGSKAVGSFLGEHTGGLAGSLVGMAGGAAGALAFAEKLGPSDVGTPSVVNSPQQTNEIHVHGAGDPASTAEAVGQEIERRWDAQMSQAESELLPLVPVTGGG